MSPPIPTHFLPAPARDAVLAVLASSPSQASAVLDALRKGRIDGLHYEGECCCLLGTLANARGDDVDDIEYDGVEPSELNYAETWFFDIHIGDTPESSPTCALAAAWVEEFILSNSEAP